MITFWFRLLLVVSVVSLACGCGVKGDPVVPHSWVPEAISDLAVFSRNGTLVLQWSIPKSVTDNQKRGGLAGFRIWRRIVKPGDADCPTCPEEYLLAADIDFQSLSASQKKQDSILYWDEEQKTEGYYRYQVSSYTKAGLESMRSNIATIRWITPLPAPLKVSASAGDRYVDVIWRYPGFNNGEKGVGRRAGFNIYRRAANEFYPLTPLNPAPVQEMAYRDLSVTNGLQYVYTVRTLTYSSDALIESGNSQEVVAVPADLTPPAPPVATMAYHAAEGTLVIWEPNRETDLAGYYVYRRAEGGDALERISDLITTETRFLDRNVTAGQTYYYAVTAVDSSPQHNESDSSQELMVEGE